MKLLFKQRFFSLAGSYNIFDENENVVFTVKGKLGFGREFYVYDKDGNMLAFMKRRVFTFLPCVDVFVGENYIGCIKRRFSFFKPVYTIDFHSLSVVGNFFELDYGIFDAECKEIAHISQKLFKLTDTYVIDVIQDDMALYALLVVIAIDADKSSRSTTISIGN
ncbi:MAG: LURP-one-related family protein [Clostridia bacterium]|nr:LURP-one-related family protein [Clostridia bacterium]